MGPGEHVDDYLADLIPRPRQPRTTKAKGDILDCRRCGMQWERPKIGGNKPHYCPDCARAVGSLTSTARTQPRRELGDYNMAAQLVAYRLAIEIAASALRMGNPRVALAALEDVRHAP